MRSFLQAVLVAAAAGAARAGGDATAPNVAQYEGKSAAEWTALLSADDAKRRRRAAYALLKLGPDASMQLRRAAARQPRKRVGSSVSDAPSARRSTR